MTYCGIVAQYLTDRSGCVGATGGSTVVTGRPDLTPLTHPLGSWQSTRRFKRRGQFLVQPTRWRWPGQGVGQSHEYAWRDVQFSVPTSLRCLQLTGRFKNRNWLLTIPYIYSSRSWQPTRRGQNNRFSILPTWGTQRWRSTSWVGKMTVKHKPNIVGTNRGGNFLRDQPDEHKRGSYDVTPTSRG